MKKLFSLLFVAGALSIISCGPSAEQVEADAAKAKATMDSLFNAASAAIPADVAPDSSATAPDTAAAAH